MTDDRVEVQIASTARDIPDSSSIEQWATAVLQDADAAATLCVRVVDAAESRELNNRYRGKDKPTNVLSFPADIELPDGTRILGDVVICAPVVVQEAGQQAKRTQDHFAHMVVHGVLHLLGYDHETDEQAQRMEGLEKEVLGRLGVSDPYRES